MVRNLFFVAIKAIFSIGNVKNSRILFFMPFLTYCKKNKNKKNIKKLTLTLLLALPSLVPSDGTTVVLLFAKSELFAQTFDSNFTLKDSGKIPPSPSPYNSFVTNIVISSKDIVYDSSELNTKKVYGLLMVLLQ